MCSEEDTLHQQSIVILLNALLSGCFRSSWAENHVLQAIINNCILYHGVCLIFSAQNGAVLQM